MLNETLGILSSTLVEGLFSQPNIRCANRRNDVLPKVFEKRGQIAVSNGQK